MTAPDPPAPAADPRVRNARLFDDVAESYDAVGVEFFAPIARGLVDALAPAQGERVADLGCGKGAFLLPAARAVGSRGRAVGVDVSPAMVAATGTAAALAGLAHVEVAVGDAQSPDLPAASFDVLGASLVLFFLPDPSAALAAWGKALSVGGRLGLSTFGAQDAAWQAVDDVFTPYLSPAMLDARTSGARGPFASDTGMEHLVAGAGFSEVRTIVTDLPVHFEDADHWQAFTLSTGQRAMWRAVPEAERPTVRAEAERRLAAAAHPDGGFVMHQQVRFTLGTRRPGAD
ncbi:MAG: methyltransferase domain-containing protein [Candidatus Nanopelagicales bacterium]